MARQLTTAVSLLLAVFCFSVIHPGLALRCWVCSSNNDVLCRDPFNGTRVGRVDCNLQRTIGNADYVYCEKSITSIDGGEPKVLRKCVFSRNPLEGGLCSEPSRDSDHLTVQYCATCDSDFCNGATLPGGSSAAAVAAAAVAVATSRAIARLLL